MNGLNNIVKCYEGNGPFIFASYCHEEFTGEENSTVLQILKHLTERHYCIWFDKGILPADEFPKVIYDRICNCELFIAFISKKYNESIWCAHELLTANQLNKQILPVYLDDSGEPKYLKAVATLQSIMYYEYQDILRCCDDLCRIGGMGRFMETYNLSGNEAQSLISRLERDEVPPEERARVVGLDLSSSWIREVPPCIGMLTNLERLNLSSNALRRLPGEFANLTMLRHLDLSSNSFFEFPLELTHLPNLVSLNMGGNFLKSFPECMSGLSHLKSLDFYRNWFTVFPPQICCLENLTDLDASYNQFESLPAEFFRLKKLERVDLNSTFIREVPESFSQLDALVTLDLSFNLLAAPIPFCVIEKWIRRGIFLREINEPFETIMQAHAINLLETRIAGCRCEDLLTNDLDKIRAIN